MKRKGDKHVPVPPITQLSHINLFGRVGETVDGGDNRGVNGGGIRRGKGG